MILAVISIIVSFIWSGSLILTLESNAYILYFVSDQRLMEASVSESWDDLIVEYPVKNQEEAEQLVSILDEAKIARFQMQVAF